MIAEFGLRISNRRKQSPVAKYEIRNSQFEIGFRGIVLAASTAVSKTVRPGSNPGTPATLEGAFGAGRKR
jgi:hypothetical protein